MMDKTPETPYYAAIFTSVRTEGDRGYSEMSARMVELAREQEGFLGMESARNETGITVSYWRDLDCIRKWKNHSEHLLAQAKGKGKWYQSFKVRIAKVEKEYGFEKE